MAAILDGAHEGGSPGQCSHWPLGLRVGTFQIFFKRAVGKGHPCSPVGTNRHAAIGQSVRQWHRGSEEGARHPQCPWMQLRPRAPGSFPGKGVERWGADLEGASEQTRQPRFTQRGTGQHRKRMRGSLRPRVHSCISGSQPDGKFSFWGGRTRAGPSVEGSKPGLFDLLPHSANSTVCSQTGLEMTGEPVSQVPRPSARQEAAVLSSSQVRPLSAVWSGLVCGVPRATSPPYQNSARTDCHRQAALSGDILNEQVHSWAEDNSFLPVASPYAILSEIKQPAW